MTGREWKPGDVALVDSWRGKGQIAFRCECVKDEPAWCVLDGTDSRGLDDSEVSLARPVAIVDPEDREQVERLADELHHAKVGHRMGNCYPDEYDRMQAALREFADPTPPKPNEPLNYMAVIETEDGKRYWRWAAGTMHTSVPWRLLGAVHADTEAEDGNWRYNELPVATIVSEGVAP